MGGKPRVSPEVLLPSHPFPAHSTSSQCDSLQQRRVALSKVKKHPLGLVVRTPSDSILSLLSLSGKGTVRIFWVERWVTGQPHWSFQERLGEVWWAEDEAFLPSRARARLLQTPVHREDPPVSPGQSHDRVSRPAL